jgi:hypothetical protein
MDIKNPGEAVHIHVASSIAEEVHDDLSRRSCDCLESAQKWSREGAALEGVPAEEVHSHVVEALAAIGSIGKGVSDHDLKVGKNHVKMAAGKLNDLGVNVYADNPDVGKAPGEQLGQCARA